ncbi:MAG: phosphotransferase, partial [Lentisphaerae bacterium]|nr:phosphotransferase [Lentisphaerota bacterium]
MLDLYGRVLPTFKGAFHTHTTLSDGIFAPAEVVRLYREAGYDILALTDHRKTNRVSELDSMGLTLISGMEMHPAGPRGIPWHIVALNVPESFEYPEG